MKVQKKVGGTNPINKFKIKILFIFFVLFFSKVSLANIILDHEIEKFLKEIIKPIIKLSHSNFNESDLIIILEKTPNAFVNQDKKIILTTGLFTFANRPEEILGILAHEIGHLDANHIDMRIEKLKNHKSISELSKIISLSTSLITNNPDFFIGTNIAYDEIAKNNISNFSKDQEREADIIALKYLEKNQISSNGLKNFLERLIVFTQKIGIKEEDLIIYTHPYKKERIENIIKFQKKSKYNNYYFSDEINLKFNFVKAKINGYTLNTENNNLIYKYLDNDEKKYALSISYAKDGYIKESLNLINDLIIKYPKNSFFYETKGEILLNYGYSNEAVKFFEKSLILDEENEYLRMKLIFQLYNKLEKIDDAKKILVEFNKLKNKNNNNLLNIVSNTYDFMDNISEKFYYLALIEKNKKNYILSYEYVKYAKLNTKNNGLLEKYEKLINEVKNEIQ